MTRCSKMISFGLGRYCLTIHDIPTESPHVPSIDPPPSSHPPNWPVIYPQEKPNRSTETALLFQQSEASCTSVLLIPKRYPNHSMLPIPNPCPCPSPRSGDLIPHPPHSSTAHPYVRRIPPLRKAQENVDAVYISSQCRPQSLLGAPLFLTAARERQMMELEMEKKKATVTTRKVN